jgi:hypothetical protein
MPASKSEKAFEKEAWQMNLDCRTPFGDKLDNLLLEWKLRKKACSLWMALSILCSAAFAH